MHVQKELQENPEKSRGKKKINEEKPKRVQKSKIQTPCEKI